jgi:hypothetical protein
MSAGDAGALFKGDDDIVIKRLISRRMIWGRAEPST